MAALKDKLQNGLDEVRILVLGGQVLLGFFFRSIFMEQFPSLPTGSQRLILLGVALLLVSVALLLAPGAFHRLVEHGADTPRMQSMVSLFADPVLMPFSLAFGIALYVPGRMLLSLTVAWWLAALGVGVGLLSFYGLELVQRHRRQPHIQELLAMSEKEPSESKLKDRIRHVLTETRVVLPGAQALLGFQFSIFLTKAFAELPRASQLLHLGAMAMVGLATVFLLTPAAYHRIVERGEETEHFHRFASLMMLLALVPLALGSALDFYVAVLKVMRSQALAVACAVLVLALMYGLWFGLAWAVRLRGRPSPQWQRRSLAHEG